MITIELYHKIQEYKRIGLSQRRTAANLGIAQVTVRKWWDATEKEFLDAGNTHSRYLDNYKEFMLEQIRICPQIKVTNLYYKVTEAFHDFEVPRSAFYRYVQKLRSDYGYDRFTGRQITPRAPLPPGYEAQVDFGQSKMKDMYGRIVRVYFFCMVLSYSRMHFVYFNSEPFKTNTAIQAHEYAFRYFGGRTQTIMYDQDRVFVVSENLGNIILVPEFEDYVNTTGYSVVLCRPRDPQTKGKVECFVKYVKDNFLEGRIFTGIDSLNSAALAWLDTEANGTPNYDTKRIPREMFMEEAATLTKVPYHGNFAENIRNVSAKYDVTYLGSRYQLPKEIVRVKEPIRIEESDDELRFIRTYDGTVIHTAPKAEKPGEHIPVVWESKDIAVSLSTLKRIYDGSDIATRFIIGVEQQVTRYKNTHYRWVIKLSRVYTIDQMEEAMEHCLKVDICTAQELTAFLIYRHGESVSPREDEGSLVLSVQASCTAASGGARMTSITEIQELARTLNLQNLARGDIDITNDKDSQRAYLLKILQEEVNLRHQANLVKREKIARIPKKEFLKDRLNSGVAWQIERLEQLDWIEQDQNLILIGKCATGKTSLAAHLGKKALEAGIKVCYSTFDDFIYTIRNKTQIEKQKNRWRYFTYSSLIIVDDVMYTGMTGEELMLFYHSMMLLNETRSIVLITNRELSAWLEATEDKHLMQTFLDRITANSQIIRLN